ncbi:hypothetical protein [Pseudomonas sp. PS01301]|uniref:hypothetical protein n=1 Tax=Pseudomonas sp. PS01301 TaxID=2991437 RepID=UPI00249A3A0F|nr:hypothetical protein [Pseudomonas sp. PS01301]
MTLHEVYIGHVMGCPHCYAPKNRYCTDGAHVRADYLAAYLMELEPTVAKSLMRAEKRDNPSLFPGVADRVRELQAEQVVQEDLANG